MSGNTPTPSIGRIVLYCLGFDEHGAFVQRPARIVSTKGGVNLVVDIEPTDDEVTLGDASRGGSPVRAAVAGAEVARLSARRVDVREWTGDLTPEAVGTFSFPYYVPSPAALPDSVIEGIDRDLKSIYDRVAALEQIDGTITDEKGTRPTKVKLTDCIDDMSRTIGTLVGANHKNETLIGKAREDVAATALRVDDLERKVAAGVPAPVSPAVVAAPEASTVVSPS